MKQIDNQHKIQSFQNHSVKKNDSDLQMNLFSFDEPKEVKKDPNEELYKKVLIW